jgi:homoserine dehydrogenase
VTHSRPIDLILVGLGNVHRQFLHLLDTRRPTLAKRYGLELRVVGAVDSQGAVAAPDGIAPSALLAHKLAGGSAAELPGGRPGHTAIDLIPQLPANALLEATPVNLRDAQPALATVLAALAQGMDVVLANKAPLALAYQAVMATARSGNARLAFSATVCGGLPVVNIGQRDLVAAQIHRVEGIFNSTSNYILTQMAAGNSYQEALAEAQRRGIAETDPTLDVDGWDTANKLTIVANAVLGCPTTIRDVHPILGIRDLPPAGQSSFPEVVRLLGVAARRPDGGYDLSVQPVRLPPDHQLAHVDGWQMGVVYQSDLYETLFIAVDERDPTATAAAMLRDVVNLYLG